MLHALSPILAACAAAYLLDLPARAIEQRLTRLSQPYRRASAVLAALALILTMLTAFTALLVPRIRESAEALLIRWPEYFATLQALVSRYALTDALQKALTSLSGAILRAARSVGGSVAASVADIGTAAICTLYLLFCKHSVLAQCRAFAVKRLKPQHFRRLTDLVSSTNAIFSRYITGRVVESAVLAVLCLVGLLLSGVPYAPLLALLVGAGNLVPFLGSIVAAVPCVLLLVAIDPVKAVWFLIFLVALQQLDNAVLSPRIVGASVGLPSFWAMLAVLIGARLCGAAGAFLGIPCAAVIAHALNAERYN